MPGSEEFVQRAVHTLETGAASVWLRRTFIGVVLAGVAVVFLINFRGLATAQAMDQAQIGRSLARGQGWHTNYVRPLALNQLQSHGRSLSRVWSDVYNAPLPPLVNAIVLFPLKSHLQPNPKQIVPLADRVIAGLGLVLFFASLGAQYLLIQRLFDRRLALISCTFLLLCEPMWQYALSGLPQMLLLLLFNLTLFTVLRAVEENVREASAPTTRPFGDPIDRWLAAAGAGFGLLALGHGLTIWMFIGALVFAGLFFVRRTRAILILLGAFLILYTPWLIRNWVVCGNPFGLGFYSVLAGVGGHDEAGWFRQITPQFSGVGVGALREKFLNNIVLQMGRPIQYLGGSIVAAVFFLSLLHRFRRPEISSVRWFVLLVWLGGFIGMAVFGLDEEQGFSANQLHLLFVPIMTAYGLAWLLLQWRYLGFELRLARIAFLAALLFLCAFPMANTLYEMLLGSTGKLAIRWPPYIPPYLAVLNEWMRPEEVTASDMPWAVAWYSDRPGLLVPKTVKEMNDIGVAAFNAPVAGLYLTPISGSENKYGDIMHGDYADWAAVIQQGDLGKYPFKWGTLALGFEKQCEFLSDRDRTAKPSP